MKKGFRETTERTQQTTVIKMIAKSCGDLSFSSRQHVAIGKGFMATQSHNVRLVRR